MLPIHRLNRLGAVLHKVMAALRVHQHSADHGFPPQQHAMPHRIAIGEREFDGPLLIAQDELLANHVAGFHKTTGVLDTTQLNDGSLMPHNNGTVVLQRVHLEADPVGASALKGRDVEGMQRRRRRA